MASRVKEDEDKEGTQRGLIKQPGNRKRINAIFRSPLTLNNNISKLDCLHCFWILYSRLLKNLKSSVGFLRQRGKLLSIKVKPSSYLCMSYSAIPHLWWNILFYFGPKSFLIVSVPKIVKHILKDNSKSYSKVS